MYTILFTGGHHNSALVVAQRLRQQGYDVVWFGHRFTMIGDRHDSLEYQEVTAASIPFINLLAGKFPLQAHPVHWLRLPLGFLQALFLLLRFKPKLILAFGGYISVPVAVAGFMLKIPVLTFEQTTVIGKANELVSRFSRHNFLAWESSLKFFPKDKSSVVGLPLQPEIFTSSASFYFTDKKSTILITGGKQGSHPINHIVNQALQDILSRYNVIHQTGGSLKTQDYQIAQGAKLKLPTQLYQRYHIQPHFTSAEMIKALKACDLVVTRSGAHIVAELLFLGKPCLLIPLPFSYRNEQLHNAHKLVAAGLGVILPQEELTPQRLVKQIHHLATHFKRMKRQGFESKKLIQTTATQTIVDYIQTYYPHAPA